MTNMPANFNEQLIASLSSGVIAIGAQGTIMTANQAAADHLGVGIARLQPGVEIDQLEGIKALVSVKLEMLETKQPISRRELEIESPGGTRTIGLTASLLQGPEEFNGAIFLFTDLTKLRELERAATLNHQLAQIGELTAGVVHELRSPLSVVSGMSELLLRKLKDADNYRKAELIHDEPVNMSKLISQFLSFSVSQDPSSYISTPAKRKISSSVPFDSATILHKIAVSMYPRISQMTSPS
jgi:nitrogen-specific signal transduction histidine kinase